MADLSFADVKVHNEVEFCAVSDRNIKKQLERLFLDHRISYYEKWNDSSFFSRLFGEYDSKCTLCINKLQMEKAVEIMEELPLNRKDYEMVLKRNDKTFF